MFLRTLILVADVDCAVQAAQLAQHIILHLNYAPGIPGAVAHAVQEAVRFTEAWQ